MDNICRLCLNDEAKLIELFAGEQPNQQIQKIHEISNILVTPEPGCPTGICLNCNRLLEISWKFCKQIQESHIFITDTLKNICIDTSCGDEIVLEEHLDRTESDVEDKEIAVDIVTPEDDDVFFEIEQIESEVDEPLELIIKDEVFHPSSSDSQPIADIDESVELSIPNQQNDNHLHCETCNRDFQDTRTYRKHMKRHMVERQHKCDICDKRFFEANGLTIHQRTHTGERPYKCSICDKQFTQAGNLHVHERAHRNERNYKCLICAKRFKQLSHLNEHLKIHSNVRMFKCDQCDYGATKLSSLKSHLRTHTGEKPFECAFCSKTFNHLSNFRTHVRIHTGEKRYSCQYCSKPFVQHSAMTRHEKMHTKKLKSND